MTYDEQRKQVRALIDAGDLPAAFEIALSKSFSEARIEERRAECERLGGGKPVSADVAAEVGLVSAWSALQSARVALSMAKAVHERLARQIDSSVLLIEDLEKRVAALEGKA